MGWPAKGALLVFAALVPALRTVAVAVSVEVRFWGLLPWRVRPDRHPDRP